MKNNLFLFTLLLSSTSVIGFSTISNHMRLTHDLFAPYSPLIAPIATNKPLVIEFHFIPQHFDVTNDGFIEGEFWYTLIWKDIRLQWDPEDYEVESIHVTKDMIWTPDIVPLSGGVEEKMDERQNVLVDHNGKVYFYPRVFLKARCSDADLVNPWNEFNCTLKYGSWSHNRKGIDFYESVTGSVPHIQNDPTSPIYLKNIFISKGYDMRFDNEDMFSELYFTMTMKRKRMIASKAIIFRPETSSSRWSTIYGFINTYSWGLL